MALFNESKLIDASKYAQRRCKATIQKTGKLGFSANAATLMGLTEDASLLVSECGERDFAVVVSKVSNDRRGFRVRRSSLYFAVDMKAFFDQRGVDYRNPTFSVAYDIVPLDETFEGKPVFKLTYRAVKHRPQKEVAMA